MILFIGIGELSAILICLIAIDRIGNLPLTFLLTSFVLVQFVLFLSYILNEDSKQWMTFIMCLIWGLQDGTTNIQILETLSCEFENKSDPFAIFNMVQTFAVLFMYPVIDLVETND